MASLYTLRENIFPVGERCVFPLHREVNYGATVIDGLA